MLPLAAITVLAVAVRAYADGAGEFIKPYMGTYYTKELAALAEAPWWSFFLPVKEFAGRWGTTGFLLVHWLETKLGEPNAFYFLSAVMVWAGYLLTYLTFRSLSVAVLTGIALATTTFNYHVYSVSGSVIMLPLVTYLLLFVYCQVRWVQSSERSRLWAFLTIASLVLFALSYEGWLDFVPLAWIVYPALAWHFRSFGDRVRASRSIILLFMVTAAAASYVIIKVATGLEGLHPRGGEADLILTYGRDYVLLMVEDVISSYFTFYFTTISTYLPPEVLSFSLSSWIYGPNKIVALQEGYHSNASHLAHYNHLFLWRYYAGFMLAVFLFLYWNALKRFFSRGSTHDLILFVLMTCTLIGSPTHLIIKWRPMHAAPFLGYQCYLSIVGFTLLLCYCISQKAKELGPPRGYALILLFAVNLVYCAYARPSLLSHMSQESFLGAYPDPRINLRPGGSSRSP
jgi:hypothetical protein